MHLKTHTQSLNFLSNVHPYFAFLNRSPPEGTPPPAGIVLPTTAPAAAAAAATNANTGAGAAGASVSAAAAASAPTATGSEDMSEEEKKVSVK